MEPNQAVAISSSPDHFNSSNIPLETRLYPSQRRSRESCESDVRVSPNTEMGFHFHEFSGASSDSDGEERHAAREHCGAQRDTSPIPSENLDGLMPSTGLSHGEYGIGKGVYAYVIVTCNCKINWQAYKFANKLIEKTLQRKFPCTTDSWEIKCL